MEPEAARNWHELARRTGDGVEVTLLWDKSIDLVKVVVSDGRLCHHLDFDITGADALKAFHQPFAFASTNLRAMSSGASARL